MGTVDKEFEMKRKPGTFAAAVLALSFGACGTRESKPEGPVEPAEKPVPQPERKEAESETAASPKPEVAKLKLVKPETTKEPEKPEEPEASAAAQVPAPGAPAESVAEEKDDQGEEPASEDLQKRANYAIGLQIGASLVRQGTEVDVEVLGRGIADAVAGKPEMDAAEFGATMTEFQRSTQAGEAGGADEKVSYAIGLDIVRSLGSQGLDIIPERMTSGIADGIAGTPKMKEPEIREAMMALRGVVAEKASRAAKESAEKASRAAKDNLAKCSAWLAENAKREGVATLPSGLQYEVVEAGDGPSPGPNDSVTVHYKGTLIDGTEFDSSHKRGTPATFGVGRVISGWTEALQLMKVGAKWKLYIPSDLAYGENPRPGGAIKPNDALIFEVELLGIE
jgi:FKBP-type peptidyl-prolyl cis-trans isomerase FklB